MKDNKNLNNDNPRYEKKYLIPYSSQNYLRNIISTSKLSFKKQYNKRYIESFYLDDLYLTSYKDAIIGNAIRSKVRLRWYSEDSEYVKPNLEIKYKKNNISFKKTFKLMDVRKSDLISRKDYLKYIRKSYLPSYYKNLLISLHPSAEVSYRREYYKSEIIDLRLTIDNKISYKSLRTNSKFKFKRSPILERMILELKYPINVSNQVEDLDFYLPFRLSKSSKYVNAIETTFI